MPFGDDGFRQPGHQGPGNPGGFGTPSFGAPAGSFGFGPPAAAEAPYGPRRQQNAFGASAQPLGSSFNEPSMGSPWHQGGGGWGGFTGNMGTAAGGAAGGAPSGFDPNNPYGSFSGDTRQDWAGSLNRMFGAGGNAGAFDPMGSQALMSQVARQNAMRAPSDIQGAVNSARLQFGDDPQMAGVAGLQARLGGQSSSANAVQNALLQSMMQNQGFAQNVAQGLFGQNYGMQTQRLGHQLWGDQGPGLGSQIGGMLGTGLGALVGGPMGAGAGGSLGSMFGGMFGGGGSGAAGGGSGAPLFGGYSGGNLGQMGQQMPWMWGMGG